MKIAVCDDNYQELEQVLTYLNVYAQEKSSAFFCRGFSSALDLLDTLEHESFDLLFLDILMPGINGIETAKEIRKNNEDLIIVFLTTSPEYALESYSVSAYNYLLKPLDQHILFPLLDKIIEKQKTAPEALMLMSKGRVIRLPYEQIEFVEVIGKTLYFHLPDGSSRQIYGRLLDYEETLLKRQEFFKVHRSYIVNFQWAKEVSASKVITASGAQIPVARSIGTSARSAYWEFLFAVGMDMH